MKSTITVLLGSLAVVLVFFAPACRAAAPAASSSEARVLERFVGQWDAQASVTAPGRDPVQVKATFSGALVASGKYMEAHQTRADRNSPTLSVLSYDAAAGAYHSWEFAESGVFECTGPWDPEKKTLTLTGKMAQNDCVYVFEFPDDNTILTRATLTARTGTLLATMNAKYSRSK